MILVLALGPFKRRFMLSKKEGDMVDTSDIEQGDTQELFLRHDQTFPEEHFDHDDPRARCSSLVEGG